MLQTMGNSGLISYISVTNQIRQHYSNQKKKKSDNGCANQTQDIIITYVNIHQQIKRIQILKLKLQNILHSQTTLSQVQINRDSVQFKH